METQQSSSQNDLNGNPGLNIATFNLHGFKCNWSYFQDLSHCNDVIFLQEHWLIPSELDLLKNVNNDFVIFAKSSMEDKCKEGLLTGRPYGGVAVAVRKSLKHNIRFCGSDLDGRVICVKVISRSIKLLIFGCYFPCNDNSQNYLDSLSRVLGYIDSIATGNPGFRVCILGDLNFECTSSNSGYRVFDEFANELSLVSCDDLITDNDAYTYHHKTLNHKSFIDHVFIGSDLKSQIEKLKILDDALNLSDHLPIVFHLKLPDLITDDLEVNSKVNNRVRDFRWDKGNLEGYYFNTGNLLNRISHDHICELSSAACSSSDHMIDIDIYYCEIVHALSLAAVECIPRVPCSALKHYWSVALDDLKRNSKDAYDLWILDGRPHSGSIYNLMKDAKYKYKLGVRHAVREYEDRFSDELYDQLLAKDMPGFWKTWSSKSSKKVINIPNVDGSVGDPTIAEVFRRKFESETGSLSDVMHSVDNISNDDVSNWMLTIDDVEYVIRNNMKCGKAAGFDNLTLEHIVYSHPSIMYHLCKLFNSMLKHGYVPAQFGRGIVIPLIKDKNGDVTNSDNYRGITVSPVISKIFECCLMLKFEPFLYSSELQLGFKKNLGCGPALFMFQQVVKYFTNKNSTVFVAAVDASKAFDRINHAKLLNKLRERKLPLCFIKCISCWYSKLYSVVRWNSIYSSEFKVLSGVRQGGILSPILFNVYVDDMIEELKHSGFGCYFGKTFLGCIMYADDLLLLSPSINGLQSMLDVCSLYGSVYNITFNALKTVVMSIGHNITHKPTLLIAEKPITWVDCCKYLGVLFIARSNLVVNVVPIKRKFYAALNSVFSRSSAIAEPVKVQLVQSFCLPLLTYCIGALELSIGAINELSVCWNDAFRKIFNYKRWESVKLLQFFCGCLDFKHIYELARLKFLSRVVHKLSFLQLFCSSLELQYNTFQKLCNYYGANDESLSTAVYDHFQCLIMQSYVL